MKNSDYLVFLIQSALFALMVFMAAVTHWAPLQTALAALLGVLAINAAIMMRRR